MMGVKESKVSAVGDVEVTLSIGGCQRIPA